MSKKNSKIYNFFLILILALCSVACDESYYPRPKGLNHIELPDHSYQKYSNDKDPFSFEFSKEAFVIADTANFADIKKHYKIIKYTDLKASLHLTYKETGGNIDTVNSLIDESYRLAYGHDVKAYGITPKDIKTAKGYRATLIRLEGEVPSTFQFYVYDTLNHFMRGALYFPSATKNDSLAPVIDFVVKDTEHMLHSLTWK